MTIEHKSDHERQLTKSKEVSRKKHYEPPRLTLLKLNPVRSDLLARAISGGCDAEEQSDFICEVLGPDSRTGRRAEKMLIPVNKMIT